MQHILARPPLSTTPYSHASDERTQRCPKLWPKVSCGARAAARATLAAAPHTHQNISLSDGPPHHTQTRPERPAPHSVVGARSLATKNTPEASPAAAVPAVVAAEIKIDLFQGISDEAMLTAVLNTTY